MGYEYSPEAVSTRVTSAAACLGRVAKARTSRKACARSAELPIGCLLRGPDCGGARDDMPGYSTQSTAPVDLCLMQVMDREGFSQKRGVLLLVQTSLLVSREPQIRPSHCNCPAGIPCTLRL